MSEKCCRGCKWWHKNIMPEAYSVEQDYAECMRFWQPDAKLDFEGPGVDTDHDFYCNQWEANEDG